MNLVLSRPIWILVLRALLTLLAVLPWPVAAIEPATLVIVAARNNTEPLARFDGDRLESGLLRDLGDLLAERLGRRASYLVLPARRTERALMEGQADLMCYVMPAWVSSPLQWTVPVLPDAQLLVARSDAPKLETLHQLARRRVGTVLGYTYPQPHQVLGDHLMREDAVNMEGNLRKLMVGRIEFALTEQLAFSAFMKGHPGAALRVELVLERFTAPCALSPRSRVPLGELNRVLRQLQQEGAIERMLARYR